MRIKVQNRTSLKAGSLFLEKHTIFPTRRTGRSGACVSRAGTAPRPGGKGAGMVLPVRARGAFYSAPGDTQKGRERPSGHSPLSLHTSQRTAGRRRQTGEGTCWQAAPVGVEAKGHLAQSRTEGALRKLQRGRRRTACARRGERLWGTLRPGRGARRRAEPQQG